jgi:hypothetical protein
MQPVNRGFKSRDFLVEHGICKELSKEGISLGFISIKDSGERSHGFEVVAWGMGTIF